MLRLVLAGLLALPLVARAADSTTFLWVPSDPGDTTGNFSVAGGANVMLCTSFVPGVGISNADSLTYGITTAVTAGACSVGIYNADGSTRLATSAESSTQTCSSAGIFQVTGLTPFSLSAGTKYRVCYCTSGTNGAYTATNYSTTANHAGDLLNAFVTNIGTAANACSSGAVPATTGALSAVRHNPMLVKLSVE